MGNFLDHLIMVKNSFIKKLTTFQILILGFAAVVAIGSCLLALPISTADGEGASFEDSWFTATSAVCVTGLVTQDTATYWSTFGHIVLLILIQIGGLGVVTIAAAISMISGKRIGLMQRSMMQESISAPQVGGIVKLTSFAIKATFLFEGCGAVLMAPAFCKEFGIVKGIWYSIFHSVSAFCNAGFDLMGVKSKFSSFTYFKGNPLINIILMLLIILGGLGFATWSDIKVNKFHIKKYRMQSKVILSVSAILIVVPAVFYYFCEFAKSEWHFSHKERILSSLFQSVTARTAGFNTVDLSLMGGGSLLVMIVLMLIGGSPGSTAGGMKTTTIAVLFSSAMAVFRRKKNADFFKRTIPEDTITFANAILFMYISLCLLSAVIISVIEKLPILTCLFETASAVGTVGVTLGITSKLGGVSHAILCVLMFMGRVGGINLIFAAVSGNHANMSKLPQERITVG